MMMYQPFKHVGAPAFNDDYENVQRRSEERVHARLPAQLKKFDHAYDGQRQWYARMKRVT